MKKIIQTITFYNASNSTYYGLSICMGLIVLLLGYIILNGNPDKLPHSDWFIGSIGIYLGLITIISGVKRLKERKNVTR